VLTQGPTQKKKGSFMVWVKNKKGPRGRSRDVKSEKKFFSSIWSKETLSKKRERRHRDLGNSGTSSLEGGLGGRGKKKKKFEGKKKRVLAPPHRGVSSLKGGGKGRREVCSGPKKKKV